MSPRRRPLEYASVSVIRARRTATLVCYFAGQIANGVVIRVAYPSCDHRTAIYIAAGVLDCLPLAAAIVDGRGTVVAANATWQEIGALVPDYLSCEADLACCIASREVWFEVRVRRVGGDANLRLVTYSDVTDQRSAAHDASAKRAQQAGRERQALQHQLLARFGQFALESPPFHEVLAEAVEVVRRGLDVQLCRVLEATEDDSTLLHVAGCGWSEASLQSREFDAALETENRFVLGARESFVVEDYATQARVKASPIQRLLGVRSSAEALISRLRGGTYGMIGAYAYEPGHFDRVSADFIQSIANTLAAFIERKRTEDRLAYMAQFDALTGLPNRTLYLDRLAHSLVEAGRDKLPVGVLFVDIDRFKGVNDTLGHAIGDQLLVEIATRLSQVVRPTDTVGRLSGDEFAIALAHLTHAEDAGIVAQKVVASLAEPFTVNGSSVYVSASVGISIHPSDGTEPDILLKNADAAMYRAKEAGRSGYQFFVSSMHERAVQRTRTGSMLRGAVDRREYVLHYQPKIEIASGRISGLEALLRWQSPDRGLVPPGDFIAVLEDTGLIVEVGEWVIKEVCAQIRRWESSGIPAPPVAINLSPRQLRQPNLTTMIADTLSHSRVAPTKLEFELTETALMADLESAAQVLQTLKSTGVRISLDDFGTGYSSLTHIRRFPLDALKIDRGFVNGVTDDPDDATIVTAVIGLAHNLHLRVIAEGVETQAHLEFLRTHGCDEAQGYYFARPLAREAITRKLAGQELADLGVPLSAHDGPSGPIRT
jgi:diguanylate cyclase (GGDEF)-like protein